MKFDTYTDITVKIAGIWDVTPSGLLDTFRRNLSTPFSEYKILLFTKKFLISDILFQLKAHSSCIPSFKPCLPMAINYAQ